MFSRAITALFMGATALLAAGCAQFPGQSAKVDVLELPAQRPQPSMAAAANQPLSGSIYQSSMFRPGFENPRARLPGDVVTVQITENLAATQNSTSTVDRSSNVESSVTAFPFLKATQVGKLNLGAESANTFAGRGANASTNTFTGTITTTVIDVLPNGHLVVAGDKQLGVNQNVEVLRFSGIVDPRFLQPGSVVPSTQVAQARIEQRGRGAAAESHTMGWLSRFVMSINPF
jgi:flagellar L-ring protein FlgH